MVNSVQIFKWVFVAGLILSVYSSWFIQNASVEQKYAMKLKAFDWVYSGIFRWAMLRYWGEPASVKNFVGMINRATMKPGGEAVKTVFDYVVDGTSDLRIRIYTPIELANPKLSPAVLYFHGGGFMFGSIEESDRVCRALANSARMIVINVGYRTAPEHKFPTAIEDSIKTLGFIFTNGNAFGIDVSRIALVGDDAGGNIVAAVTHALRDNQLLSNYPQPRLQVLVYPILSTRLDSESMSQHGSSVVSSHFISKALLDFYLDAYLRDDNDKYDSRVDILNSATSFKHLPSAVVMTMEGDPLHDEAVQYAETLMKNNVTVEHVHFPDYPHNLLSLMSIFERECYALINEIADHLKDKL